MTQDSQRAAIGRVARSISDLDADGVDELADRMLEAGEVVGDEYHPDDGAAEPLEAAVSRELDEPIEWFDTERGAFLLDGRGA